MRPTTSACCAAMFLSIVLAFQACAELARQRPVPLAQLVGSYERETAPYFPFTASERGDHRYDRMLANDISEEYRSGLKAICARYGDDLRRIDTAALNDQERLTFDIFGDRLATCVERLGFPWHLMPVTQLGWSLPSGFPVVGAGRGTHPFKTVRNYEDFLGRIDGFVTWVDTAIANMRRGMARGITQPRDVILAVIPQLDAQIVDDPRASVFYQPARNLPDELDADTRRALTDRYLDAIAHKIVPTYRKLRAFIQDEYLPTCRTSYGLSDVPGGHDMYRFAARVSTTTTMTPAEIHDLGLAEVRRITAGIDALRAEIDAAHEPEPASYRSIADLLNAYGELRAAVQPALPRLFGRLPKAGFEIRPIEAFRERSAASNYEPASLDGSRPGVFYLNVAELRSRGDARVSRALFLHEAVPGHHLQIALQRENAALPTFRRFGWYTAFAEGWALYAESLGDELGVHQTRRHRLDVLYAELFRAARLVVDIGLHDKGWTRERAIAYLGGSRENAEREVDRYMAWPAQALGYKIGEIKIRGLRNKAQAALGASFDVRVFHDELLKDGAMPLTVLETKMDRWVAERSRR